MKSAYTIPAQITTPRQARDGFRHIIEKLGGGFHPDESMGGYIE